MRVDDMAFPFAVGVGGRETAFIQMVVDHIDPAGAGLPDFPCVGLKIGRTGRFFTTVGFCFALTDTAAVFAETAFYFVGGCPLHIVRDMGIDIQRSLSGGMSDDRGKRFNVHPVG